MAIAAFPESASKPQLLRRGLPDAGNLAANPNCPLGCSRACGDSLGASPLSGDSVRASQLSFTKGQIIRAQGSSTKRSYAMRTGWAMRFRVSSDGRRQVFSFYLPGDLIDADLTADDQGSCGVRALTPVRLCVFESSALLALRTGTRSSTLELIGDLKQKSSAADRTIFLLGQCSAYERIVHFIMGLRARAVERGAERAECIDIPLQREDIADAMGLTPVHVSRTLARLKSEGLMEFRCGVLRVLNERRLMEIAASV